MIFVMVGSDWLIFYFRKTLSIPLLIPVLDFVIVTVVKILIIAIAVKEKPKAQTK